MNKDVSMMLVLGVRDPEVKPHRVPTYASTLLDVGRVK